MIRPEDIQYDLDSTTVRNIPVGEYFWGGTVCDMHGQEIDRNVYFRERDISGEHYRFMGKYLLLWDSGVRLPQIEVGRIRRGFV
jgi:hypothetical protein